MRLEKTIPDLLFPIQPSVIDKKYSEIKKRLSLENSLKPIPVIEYNNGFIMLDGHNTGSILLYEINRRTLDIEVQENDNEAGSYFKGALQGIKTIPEFIKKYEKEFRARCEKAGVVNCWDLKPPLNREKRRNYFC